jgi:hypothetical protein
VQHVGFADTRCMPFLGTGLCFMEEINDHDHHSISRDVKLKTSTRSLRGISVKLLASTWIKN